MEWYSKASEKIINNIVKMQTEYYQGTIDLVNSLQISETDKNLLIYKINNIYDWRERYMIKYDDEQEMEEE